MSTNTQVNSLILDFPIQRQSSLGENTGVFAIGTLYPTSTEFASVTLDFGDGTTTTVAASSGIAKYNQIVAELSRYTGFFPDWQNTAAAIAKVAAPMFTITHQYENAGVYNVQATLTTVDDISYVGTQTAFNVYNSAKVVPPDYLPGSLIGNENATYSIPDGWSTISQEYTTTNGTNLLFTDNNLPVLRTTQSVLSSLPSPVEFLISNIAGRVDIDYIEWVYGDGSTSVTTVLGSPITEDLSKSVYYYRLLPSELSYSPNAALYVRKGTTKYKLALQSPDIVFQDRVNIIVSVPTISVSKLKTYGFNLTPSTTDTFPIECRFTVPVTRELKYIFWNHDDGTYDMTPVVYDETTPFINQYITHKHTYTSHNVNPFLPGCILVFEDAAGAIYSEYHRSRNYLDFDNGLVNPADNYFVKPVLGIDGYVKYDNLSMLPVYKENGVVDVYIRLSLGYPSQIYLFDKIIWSINGKEFVQNKNTAKDFGYIVARDVVVPTDFNIEAFLYGIPAIYAKTNNNELQFHDSYSYSTSILGYDQWLKARQSLINILLKEPEVIPPQLPPTITIITSAGDTQIITPVIESTLSTTVTSFIALTGIDISFNKLFAATSPASNFLNRDFPSSATTDEFKVTVPKRDVGYFTPPQTSNIIVEPGQFTFTLDADVADFNKPYYFPDPFRYGSETPVLTFSFNEDSFKNGNLFTIARNRPNTSDNFITFDGYTSLKSLNPNYDISDIVNSGYFHNFADDIFGNRYGLLKANNFESTVTVGEPILNYTNVFNGYKFFDSYFGNGYTFNYFTPLSSGNEIIVPGLSTFTGAFSSTGSRYTLKFGKFAKDTFQYAKEPFDVTTQYRIPLNLGFRDCATFVIKGTELLNDSISSDLSTFSTSTTGVYYFSELFEAGVFTAVPYVRPLRDTVLYPGITARFTQSVRVSGDNGVDDVDCALFKTIIPVERDLFNLDTISLDLTAVNPQSVTQYVSSNSTTADLVTRDATNGVLYIKDRNGKVDTLLNTLPYLSNRYTTNVIAQLSSCVRDFDVVYDTLFIQTSSLLVIDKVTGTNSSDLLVTEGRVVEYNANPFNKLSNRYKVDSNVYFVTLSAFNTTNTDTQSIVPMIYKYSLADNKVHTVYPNNTTYVDDNVIQSNVLFTETSAPVISFTQETQTFNLTYIAKDQNKSPTLVFINFKDVMGDVITKSVYTNLGSIGNTTVFTSLSTLSNFSVLLSSQTIAFSTSAMIL
jgi:hypothetical protein